MKSYRVLSQSEESVFEVSFPLPDKEAWTMAAEENSTPDVR